MRTETRTVRVGENMGPIDWSYNFRSHFDNYCTTVARRDELCADAVEDLRKIVAAHAAGQRVTITTDGGCPKFGWHELIDVGMYDGWPYWKPTPSVFTRGPLGGEWHSFGQITGYRIEAAEGKAGR